MTQIPINERRHSVTIETPTYALNSFNEAVATWATYSTRWAKMECTGTSEPDVALSASPRRAYRFTFHCVPGLTSEMQIKKGSRIFRIVGPPVDLDEAGIYHVVETIELEPTPAEG